MTLFTLTTRLSFLAMLALLAQSTLADDAVALPSVTVIGQQTTSLGIQHISGNEIRQYSPDLASFIRRLQGLQVQSSGGLGDPVMVSVRGASTVQTRLLINGVEQNTSSGGGYDLSAIPLSMIERVEIVQSGSHQGGEDSAIGGSINIITQQADRPSHVQAGLGSYGYREFSARAVSIVGVNEWSLQGHTERTLNNYSMPTPAPWFGDPAGTEEPLNNAQYFRHNVIAQWQREDVSSQLHWSRQNKHIPDYFRNAPPNRAHLSKRQWGINTGNLNAPEPTQDGLHWLWQLSHQDTFEKYRDPEGYIGLNDDDNRYHTQHSEVTVTPQWRTADWQFNAGFSGAFDQYQSRFVNDPDASACSTPVGGCNLTAQQQKIKVRLGSRWAFHPAWHAQLQGYQEWFGSQQRRTEAEPSQKQSNQQAFTGGSAAIGHSHNTRQLELSLRRSVRIPSLYERFGDRGLLLGNDDLKPEIADTLSFDSQWQFSANVVRVNVFHRQLTNAIVPLYDSRGIGRYENVGKANLTGLELSHEMQFLWGDIALLPNASVSLYDSENKSRVRAFQGKQLPGIYHQRYLAGLTVRHQDHSVSAHIEVAGDSYLDSANNVSGDIRRSVDISYSLQRIRWQASLYVINLLNNQFRDYSNRPVPGRNARASIDLYF